MKRIEFKVTANDYLAVNAHIKRLINNGIRLHQNKAIDLYQRISNSITGILIGIFVAVLFVVPFMLFIVNNPASLNLYVGYLFFILFLLLFIGSKIHVNKFKKLIDSQLRYESPSIVVIGDQGIEDVSDNGRTVYKWQGIASIDYWHDYILFRSRLYKGIFIPTRAFSSQEELHNFLSEAHSYLAISSNKAD